ncbi:hypothetical protein NM688_g137 [Phlebia brevispora]|uniref:Uncharacterized protein n=1 Tax=Phlebia brevispora TaxID=194682 RepID=A0ACC1TF80_9APHY|nr:hypothetical protein NM688_g137 [Phlebia brevispora]
MPKSTRKKKDKAADFSARKGKQTPSNAVDTTFKARSIALPSQSITQSDSGGVPSTKRRLTLDDLLAHLKHYNPGTRRDALYGFKELFEENPDILLPSLTPLINGCVRVIGDEDSGVRKALLTFFSWLFVRVSLEDLLPHASVLLLFTTSAQTHIFPEIRIDAIRFLDLLLQHVPTVVVEGWAQNPTGHARRVLDGYLGILNAGTAFGEEGDTGPIQATSTASVVLSPASKLVVLKSLSAFLSAAILQRSSRRIRGTQTAITEQLTPTWFFARSFSSRAAFDSFNSLITPASAGSVRKGLQDTRHWNQDFDARSTEEDFVQCSTWAVDRIDSSLDFKDITNMDQAFNDAEASADSSIESSYIMQIARTLQPVLIATFLDYCSTAFSPSSVPPETDLQLVLSAVAIARVLYCNISSDVLTVKDRASLSDGVNGLLGHMAAYFPFTFHLPHNAKRDIKTEEVFQSLNLTFCELSSILMLRQQVNHSSEPSHSAGKRPSVPTEGIKPFYADRVRRYVLSALRGGASVISHVQPSLARSISPSAYSALLPTIWALVIYVDAEHGESHGELLNALVDHSMSLSSNSTVKRHTVDFLGRLIILGEATGSRSVMKILAYPEFQKKLRDWLLHLPKTLWELGGNDPLTTERRSILLRETELISIRSRLTPFFVVRHATRGRLIGPYKKLSVPLRTLVLDVAFTLCASRPERELDEAIREVVTEEERQYWTSLWDTLLLK